VIFWERGWGRCSGENRRGGEEGECGEGGNPSDFGSSSNEWLAKGTVESRDKTAGTGREVGRRGEARVAVKIYGFRARIGNKDIS